MSNILSNAVTVTASNSVQVQFKLPSNTVYNLSKSKLISALTIAAQGAGVASNFAVDCFPFFGNVSFETGNGIQLLNLTDSSKYTKIMQKIATKYEDFTTRDVSDLNYPCNSLLDPLIPVDVPSAADAADE